MLLDGATRQAGQVHSLKVCEVSDHDVQLSLGGRSALQVFNNTAASNRYTPCRQS